MIRPQPRALPALALILALGVAGTFPGPSPARASAAGAGADSARARSGADSAASRIPALSGVPGAPSGAGASATAGAADTSHAAAGLDYLWVVRPALVSRESIAQVVERAHAMGARGLLVQVVGRGDAWYQSELLPRPQALSDPSLDPLGELLPLAHAAGLEVHAWMNCALVWSGPAPPRDPRHVIRAHPEWVVRLPGGRSMALMREAERRRLKLEGVFLNPAHPEARTWIANVAREIAIRYPVDGIHLDYIRQPGISLASDPASRVGFALEHGVDPQRLARLPGPQRASMDSAWVAWQARQVTAVVQEVRDSLAAVRPGLRHNAQAWRSWVRDGLIDRAFVMCYAPSVQTVLQQMVQAAGTLGTQGRVVPGIAVFNSTPAAAAAKIRAAAELGFHTLALYSYDSLFDHAGYWPELRSCLGLPPGP